MKSTSQTKQFFSFLCIEISVKSSPTTTSLSDSQHYCGFPEFINFRWARLKRPSWTYAEPLLYGTSSALFGEDVRWLLWWKAFDFYSSFYVKWQGSTSHVCRTNIGMGKKMSQRTKPESQQFDRWFVSCVSNYSLQLQLLYLFYSF